MFRTPQFITGDFTRRKVFLPDDEYGRALDCLTKAVSDVLIESADGKRVFLGRRRVEPQPDWWFVGGRARPGETTTEAAARNVKRETGLDVPAERFGVIANYSFVWGLRAQAPAENGTADTSTIHVLSLLADEEKLLSSARMDENEYADARWVDIDTIADGEYHPALKQAVADLMARRAFQHLGYGVISHAGDSVVASFARQLVISHCNSIAFSSAGIFHKGSPPIDERCQVSFEHGKYVFKDPASGATIPPPTKPAATIVGNCSSVAWLRSPEVACCVGIVLGFSMGIMFAGKPR